MEPKLAIITVVYENYQVLGDFFKSLEKQTNKNFHLFIADLSVYKKTITAPFSFTVVPSQNLGYAHGVNECLKKAIEQGFDSFCVINDDTYVEDNFVEKTLLSLKNNPETIIGGKIYYAPGYEYHKNRYTENQKGKIIWYAGGHVDWNHAITSHEGVDEVDKNEFNKTKKTNFVTGCFMAYDKKVHDKVGFWDEHYFLYYEDADFCERAKKKKIKLIYDPSIIIWHKNAQSTAGSGSKLQQKYQEINRVRFGLKYAPWKTKLHVIKQYISVGFSKKAR